jgi:hypothetical protein
MPLHVSSDGEPQLLMMILLLRHSRLVWTSLVLVIRLCGTAVCLTYEVPYYGCIHLTFVALAEFYGIDPLTANLELLSRFFTKHPRYEDRVFLFVKVHDNMMLPLVTLTWCTGFQGGAINMKPVCSLENLCRRWVSLQKEHFHQGLT